MLMGVEMQSHEILGGKVKLYKRGEVWYADTHYRNQRFKKTTKEDSLSRAKEVAEDWYMTLRSKARVGIPLTEKKKKGPTFNEIADLFEAEYEVVTNGERNPAWAKSHTRRLNLHLRPFFGNMPIAEIDAGAAQRYRVHRATQLARQPTLRMDKERNLTPSERPDRRVKVGPARSTLHDEICTVSLVLKTAIRHKALDRLPDLSEPYRASTKIVRRPRFTREEYNTLYRAAGARAKNVPERFKWNWEQLHDYILFMVNTGLRPDEADRLQHRDVKVIREAGAEILLIEVRGKRGEGWCKSMPGAVKPYRRLLTRGRPGIMHRQKERHYAEKRGQPLPPVEYTLPKPTDLVFPTDMSKLLDKLLLDIELKFDRDGKPRVAYSLRHTYICLRLEQGADIYNVAKNCRTSVEMIQKHYAIHLQNTIDARAINVRKPKSKDVFVEDGE